MRNQQWVVAAFLVAVCIASAAAQTQTGVSQTAPIRTFTPEEVAALSQGLPPGPNRETFVRACAQCHEPQRAASVRLTRDGWEAEVSKMMSLGLKLSDDDFTKVVDYLYDNYKGEAPKPINLNSATAVELESVAGLLRKEAAAWIAYRSKTPCKSLDDLKKVPGLPFDKIEKRRDRLVCF
jgi:Helix-hairpin-helix motif